MPRPDFDQILKSFHVKSSTYNTYNTYDTYDTYDIYDTYDTYNISNTYNTYNTYDPILKISLQDNSAAPLIHMETVSPEKWIWNISWTKGL